jgi:O-antigen ligase
MAVFLLMLRRVEAPRGFGAWLLFVVWVFASAVQLIDGPLVDVVVFGFRLSVYIAATIFLLYIVNIPVAEVRSRDVAMALGLFFVILIVFAYADLLLADVTFRSVVEGLLPTSLARSGYVQLLFHPKVAEVQDFLGYPVARPAAPFPYTNWWGANVAALTPFAITSAVLARSRRVKLVLVFALGLAIPPTIVSLNRGMWVSLLLGLGYAALRFALKSNYALAIAELLAIVVVAIGVFFTPARQLVVDRLETPASIEGRSSIVKATVDAVAESPLIGYAVPGEREKSAANLTVGGTSGFVWLVLYTTGWPGLVLFVAWVIAAIWNSIRPVSLVQFWAHVSILIAVVHMFFYEMLPAEFVVFMVAIGVAVRAATTVDGVTTPSDSRDRPRL